MLHVYRIDSQTSTYSTPPLIRGLAKALITGSAFILATALRGLNEIRSREPECNAPSSGEAQVNRVSLLVTCCRVSAIREKRQLVKWGSVSRERSRALLHYTIFAIQGAVRAHVRGVTRTGHTGHLTMIRDLSPRADHGLLRITHCVRREEARCPQVAQRVTSSRSLGDGGEQPDLPALHCQAHRWRPGGGGNQGGGGRAAHHRHPVGHQAGDRRCASRLGLQPCTRDWRLLKAPTLEARPRRHDLNDGHCGFGSTRSPRGCPAPRAVLRRIVDRAGTATYDDLQAHISDRPDTPIPKKWIGGMLTSVRMAAASAFDKNTRLLELDDSIRVYHIEPALIEGFSGPLPTPTAAPTSCAKRQPSAGRGGTRPSRASRS